MKLFINIIALALILTSCTSGSGGGSQAVDNIGGGNTSNPNGIPALSATSTTLNIYVGETNTITLIKSNVDICEATNLPAYATLNSTTCVVTLNPVSYASGSVTFSVLGKNSFATPVLSTAPVSFIITLVARPPTLTASANSASFAVNTAMTNITVESTSALVECSQTTVIPGISLNLVSGKCVISGTPSAVGSYTYEVLARVNGSAFGEALSIAVTVYIPPTITATQPSFSGKVGDSVSVNFNVNSGVTVSTCASNPALPTGLSLTRYSDRCALSGSIPAITSDSGTSYSITAVSSSGQTSNAVSFSITAYDVFCKNLDPHYIHPTTNNGSSSSTPIIICTAQGLIDLALDSANNGKYYRLQKNININNSSNSVIPNFNGHLNGAGYSVTYKTVGVNTCQGFIGTMHGGSIRNIHVRNVTTTDTNTKMGFVGCVTASGQTVNFNDILMTNNTVSNPDNSEYTGMFIGTVSNNTTVNVNGLYISIDHLTNISPVNFSLLYSIKPGTATVNVSSAYFTNLNAVLGFDYTGVQEVDYTTMMADPATTLTGLSSTSWSLVANNTPALVSKQNRIFSNTTVQP